MRFLRNLLLYMLLILFLTHPGFGQDRIKGVATIKYISIKEVYINAGKLDGLRIGDKISVIRGGKIIAILQVHHLSSHSAACNIIRESRKIQKGDRVIFTKSKPRIAQKKEAKPQKKRPTSQRIRAARSRKRHTKRDRAKNQMSGFFSLQNYYQQDMTGYRLSYQQPGLDGKLKIKNIAGSGLALLIRHRSRFHHRSRSRSASIPNDEWTHRLFELALVYNLDGVPVQFGIGRVLSPYIRGIGYIDGGHFAYRVLPHLLLGIAAGTEPGLNGTGFRPARQKYGAFLTYEQQKRGGRRIASTVALSASYEQSKVNREFIYLQNNYSYSGFFSLYQSVEIDINRGWRRRREGQSITFSNLYLIANISLLNSISLNFSYDARRNIRTYDNIRTPDSLFDETMHQGMSSGFRLYLPFNMSLRGNASIRFRRNQPGDNFFASFYYGIRQFPKRGHSISARLSFFKTFFSRGYRPVVTYRFPLNRQITLNLSAGGYLYQTGVNRTESYFAQVSSYFTFWRSYFGSFNFRQYFDQRLQSIQFFTEVGVNL